MEQATRFIGMDVHKDTIVVAVTASGEIGKATAYGTFPNTTASLERLVKRLRQAGDGPLRFCYEARSLRLWDSPHPHQDGPRLHGGRSIDDPA